MTIASTTDHNSSHLSVHLSAKRLGSLSIELMGFSECSYSYFFKGLFPRPGGRRPPDHESQQSPQCQISHSVSEIDHSFANPNFEICQGPVSLDFEIRQSFPCPYGGQILKFARAPLVPIQSWIGICAGFGSLSLLSATDHHSTFSASATSWLHARVQ